MHAEIIIKKWRARTVTIAAFAVIFTFLAMLFFLDPEFAFGRSVGAVGCFIIFGLLAVAVGGAAVGWGWVLPDTRWSKRKSMVYVALVFVSSLILHDVLAYVAHRTLAVGDYLMQAKIEYFCLDSFTPDQCIYHVDLCPRCAKKISRWDVTQMTARLETARKALRKDMHEPAPTTK